MNDEMDRLLHRLPEPPLPEGLARRVAFDFRRRQRRRQALQLGFSGVLVMLGSILFVPWAAEYLLQVYLPTSGIPLLAALIDSASNLNLAILQSWNGISSLQTRLNQSMDLLEAGGLLLMIDGAMLGMGPLLSQPLAGTRMRSS